MVTTLRIDENLKRDCEAVFADLGLNMTSAVTIFLRQVVRQRGIPFAVTCERRPAVGGFADAELRERGAAARGFFAEIRGRASRGMSPDEIDAEIAAARAERRARNGAASA